MLSGTCGQAAEPVRVLLLRSADQAAYHAVVEGFRATWRADPRAPALQASVTDSSTAPTTLAPGTLVIAIGVAATRTALARYPDHAVYAGLVPRPTWEHLLATLPEGRAARSAVWLDQPEHRVLGLVRLVAPRAGRVGVLLGPTSLTRQADLLDAGTRVGLAVRIGAVATDTDPSASLGRLLTEVEVLLALPDPLVWNRATVEPLMLASFRARRPLVGVSRSLLASGAIAVVHTTPEQVGAELATRLLATGPGALPAPGPSSRFAVEINAEVARSLGLHLPDAESLTRALQGAEPVP